MLADTNSAGCKRKVLTSCQEDETRPFSECCNNSAVNRGLFMNYAITAV